MGNEYKYKVSIIVATYNCEYNKLLKTIDSILKQDVLDKQIVVSDDGSDENYFDLLKDYFCNNGFEDYILVGSDKNNGTVINVIQGVEKSEGKWLKLISPGDLFVNTYDIRCWIDYVENQKREWSFCGVIYYQQQDNHMLYVKSWNHPSILNCYRENDVYHMRMNYILLGDGVNGASVICKKDLMLQYLNRITPVVKYAEDYAYILMMWDGIIPCYYEYNCIFYESGAGISTGKSRKWKKILDNERHNIYSYIINELSITDDIQRKIKKRLSVFNHGALRLYLYILWRSIMLIFEPKRYTYTEE